MVLAMARPLRIEFEGALYHITSRAARREAIYEGDTDGHGFLDLLARRWSDSTGCATPTA